MKTLFLFMFMTTMVRIAAQKPAVNYSTYNSWKIVESPMISNDGVYSSYVINNQLNDSPILVIKKNEDNWEKRFTNATGMQFTKDSKTAVFLKGNDTLYVYTLKSNDCKHIANIQSYKLLSSGINSWLIYKRSKTGELLALDLNKGEAKSFGEVDQYWKDESKELLIVKHLDKSLFLQNLRNKSSVLISTAKNVTNVLFDKSGSQLALTTEDYTNNKLVKHFWIYKIPSKSLKLVADDNTKGLDNCELESITAFSNDGLRLFIKISKLKKSQLKAYLVDLDIWSYSDSKLQSQQIAERKADKLVQSFAAVLILNTGTIFRLENANERFILSKAVINDSFGLLYTTQEIGKDEQNWNSNFSQSLYFISTITGKREKISIPKNVSAPEISPHGRYLIYYDFEQRNYFSYDLTTKNISNITTNASNDWGIYGFDNYSTIGRKGYYVLKSAGWTENDRKVLLQDQYDLWLIDPLTIKPPLNITKNYGKRNHIIFRMIKSLKEAFKEDDEVVVSAFNTSTKDNGFYKIKLSKISEPELLSMGPFLYYFPDDFLGAVPIKSKFANAFLVQRMSADSSPNYFFTKDFKTFERISNTYPEQDYNWMHSELISWKDDGGRVVQGVLYKPENFDSTKKYPIIFHLYEIQSNKLNYFRKPELADGPIDIASFVSNDYLVFVPDIHYKLGQPGKSCLQAVNAAVKILSKKAFVDTTRMGIQGHSFGGYETNYIVTHSKSFAAAVSASGISDCISDYGGLWGAGYSKQGTYEDGQMRMGVTLWEKPELYIENSPVFLVNDVSTPILIMHNKADAAVSFTQSVEFFIALRRLGKKAWLLQYDSEGHVIQNELAAKDYTARLFQFFDFYLKDKAMPKWMSAGVQSQQKGIESGLEYKK